MKTCVVMSIVAIMLVAACGGAVSSPVANSIASAGPNPSPAAAASPSASPISFSGKTIHIYEDYAPGGGYDTVARLVAKYLGAHLPGDPSVVVVNRTGTSVNENALATTDPADGTAIGQLARADAVEQRIGATGVQYDVRTLQWVGSVDSSTYAVIVHADSGVKTLADLNTQSPPLRSQPVDRSAVDLAQAAMPMLQSLGYKITQPVGVQTSTPAAALAFERGELQLFALDYATLVSTQSDLITGHSATIIASVGACRFPSNPVLSGLTPPPCISDPAYVKTILPSDQGVQGFADVVQSFSKAGRPFALPPGTPAAVTTVVRTAFDATMADPAFLADALKQGFLVDPLDGAAVAQLENAIFSMPSGTADTFKNLFAPSK